MYVCELYTHDNTRGGADFAAKDCIRYYQKLPCLNVRHWDKDYFISTFSTYDYRRWILALFNSHSLCGIGKKKKRLTNQFSPKNNTFVFASENMPQIFRHTVKHVEVNGGSSLKNVQYPCGSLFNIHFVVTIPPIIKPSWPKLCHHQRSIRLEDKQPHLLPLIIQS